MAGLISIAILSQICLYYIAHLVGHSNWRYFQSLLPLSHAFRSTLAIGAIAFDTCYAAWYGSDGLIWPNLISFT